MKACLVILLWATTAIALPAQTLTTLHNFDGKDGGNPIGLVQGADGNFYGTAAIGGGNRSCRDSCGVIFRMTPDGKTKTLHSFDYADGEYPFSALVEGTDGKFYGTTYGGGPNDCGRRRKFGCGTVFKIAADGTLTTLFTFKPKLGHPPSGALVQGADGEFYGATASGGANGLGTVFRITAGGTLTTLHDFDGTDGREPSGGLVQGHDGNFYGTTVLGGDLSCGTGYGCGTVFKLTPNGSLTTLHSFDNTDGAEPNGGLVKDADGNFYGTTVFGGVYTDGTVFKITPSGELTTLHAFEGTDGHGPQAALVHGTDGNFYGTTLQGGANAGGTLFRITPGGTLTTLISFEYESEPVATLVQGTDGKFYGTTWGDGINNCQREHLYRCGTVFSFSVGLGPFVKTMPTSGTVGSAVKILGTDLTGATSMTFNGTAATFTVKSKSEITTTVPTGATTGKVRVTFPDGTRLSDVPFRVTP
jgi:uncharacterized repeat protein (TIGR03803 family)